MLLFQCLGISGLILMFYGLLAFAVTQASSWVFWTLLVLGAALCTLFVITCLPRRWQLGLGFFVAANIPWVILWATKNKPYLAAWSGKEWFGYSILGLALVLNAGALFAARRFLSELFASRSMRYGTNAVIYSVIVLAIVAVANVAGQDFYKRLDFTEAKVNTLTEQSVKLLQGLQAPLKISAFVDDRSQEKPALRELLKQYSSASKQVEVKFADPDKDRGLAMKNSARDGDIVVEFGEQSHVTREITEEAITQAIVKVTRTAKPTICFTKGHGELDIEGTEEDVRSLSAIKGGIENEGYVTKAINLVTGSVAAECGILVVAGPKVTFTQGESNAVDRYLTDGGKALLAIDPNVADPRLSGGKVEMIPSGLEDLARKWGAELGRNVILEKHLELFRGVQIGLQVLAQKYGVHPIVDPLKGRQTVFTNARSVTKVPSAKGTITELVYSADGDASWAESDIVALFTQQKATVDANDIKGPVPFAVAIENGGEAKEGEPTKPTKLVIIGNADFFSNRTVRSYEFNFDFFLNTLNWLQGAEEQISIRPKRIRTSAIELSPEQGNTIFYVAIIGIPMLVLIFGMDLWWIRRRRG